MDATRTQKEIAALQARIAELQAQDAAEEKARAGASPALLALAVGIHSKLCLLDHEKRECTWFDDLAANDPQRATWSEPQHSRWLKIAAAGCAVQAAQGWSVEEP